MVSLDFLGGSQLQQNHSLGFMQCILPMLYTVFVLSFAGQLQRMTGECCVACWRLLVPIGDGGMGSTLCPWAHTSFRETQTEPAACLLLCPLLSFPHRAPLKWHTGFHRNAQGDSHGLLSTGPTHQSGSPPLLGQCFLYVWPHSPHLRSMQMSPC